MATSPTVRQRELGLRLREARQAQEKTVEDVAKELMCSPTKISRMETGRRLQSPRDVRDLCRIYNLEPEATAELMELTRQARQPAWWNEFDDSKSWFPFIGMEQDASAITSFGMYFLPALLQTPEYARAIVRGIVPKIGADVLEERVKVRMRRQELLSRPSPPRYRALIDEAALRRQVGGPGVMKDQLERIAQLADEGKVTVQVIPYGAGAYAAADSNFEYMEFGGSDLPDLVVVEGLTQQNYIERPTHTNRYGESLEYLRDTALNLRDSVKFIRELSAEHAEAEKAS
jgi:transcriptional regulator with XRE-family HTH domain